MHRVFQRFVDCVSESPDPDSLQAALHDVSCALDLGAFAYLLMPSRPGEAVRLISNYPCEWTEHYLARHYELLDPVIERAVSCTDPFEWGLELTAGTLPARIAGFFEEAAAFGLRHGFTIPIHGRNRAIAAITFATDMRSETFRRSIALNGAVLQLLSILFHRQASLALARRKDAERVHLTRRESECLEWAAKGKSSWETGRILNVSRRTVAFHLRNAREKLGVYSTVEAVAVASRAYLSGDDRAPPPLR
jgi:LuxR family transcriptional regulator, activator of conjugal transfer of Ti plasmids